MAISWKDFDVNKLTFGPPVTQTTEEDLTYVSSELGYGISIELPKFTPLVWNKAKNDNPSEPDEQMESENACVDEMEITAISEKIILIGTPVLVKTGSHFGIQLLLEDGRTVKFVKKPEGSSDDKSTSNTLVGQIIFAGPPIHDDITSSESYDDY